MTENRPDPLAQYDDDPKFVTALARGLSILGAFRRANTTLGNQALAEKTGLPKATVSRLTYTLCKLGYLVQTDPGGEYRLTTGVMTLGFGAIAATGLHERAMIEMTELCRGDNANVTAGLGERHHLSMVYVATYKREEALALSFTLGGKVPLFSSALGRACLMALSSERQEELLEQARSLAPETVRGQLDGWLEKARSDYARYGFCTSFGEWRKEINGIAAPLLFSDPRRNLALNVGGFNFFNPPDDLIHKYGERLLLAASNLSLQP